MIQEDKELLLKDLSARLPYGVVVYIDPYELKDGYSDHDTVKLTINDVNKIYGIIERGVTVKPYLFPMSSMTEEQKEELMELMYKADTPFGAIFSENIDYFDWLNKNHFDYRGLIEKGLALDATDKNIY